MMPRERSGTIGRAVQFTIVYAIGSVAQLCIAARSVLDQSTVWDPRWSHHFSMKACMLSQAM
eukprot:9498887-Pyramimonas_sp.AAC.1